FFVPACNLAAPRLHSAHFAGAMPTVLRGHAVRRPSHAHPERWAWHPRARRRAEPMKPEHPSAPEASVVHQCLTGLVDQVCRFPRLVLGAALLLSAVSVYAAATRLEYRTQRSDLINPRKDYQERWRQYLAEFGDD